MRQFWPLVLLCATAMHAHAQTAQIPGFRISPPPKIDGVIDEAEWKGASGSSGFVERTGGGAEPESTQFWLAYDDKYLYFAARMEDKEPSQIRAAEYRSNVTFPGDDSITLSIDPFGRSDSYNQFSINPKGATGIVIAGGRALKREWLGEFSAAGRITATGWEIEARIPWGVMRLPSPGLHEASFNVFRYDPRHDRNYIWRYSPNGTENYGKWTGVQIPKSGNLRLLKLLPYGYTGWQKEGGYIADAGLDMKANLTDRIDLVGSINPDFRNVENSILSLDFSHFERLAAESRPFFLEGRGFYSTSQDAPLFASQRIKGFDVGLQTFGKLNDKTDIGLLDAVDFGNQNASVANVKFRPDPNLTLTGAYAGLDRPGLTNHGTFFSAFKTIGPTFVFAQHEATSDTVDGYGHRINAGAGYFKNGIGWDFEYLEISPQFHPRIGFAPERNLRGYFVNTNLDKLFTKGPISEAGYFVLASEYKTFQQEQYRREREATIFATLRNGLALAMDADYQRFFGSDDLVYTPSVSFPAGNPYSHVAVNYSFGHISGIQYRNLFVSGAYRPLKRLQLTFSTQDVRYDTKSTQTILGLNYDLTKDTSISGRFVRRDNETNAYLALHKAGYAGLEYYLIVGDPNADRFRTSVILKLVMPFQMKLGRT